MARDASNAAQNKKAEQVSDRRAVRRRDAFRAVLDTEPGRLVLSEVMADCGVLRAGFIADPMRLQFEAGQRNIGVWLRAECQAHAPRSFRVMEDEKALRDDADRREDEAVEKVGREVNVD